MLKRNIVELNMKFGKTGIRARRDTATWEGKRKLRLRIQLLKETLEAGEQIGEGEVGTGQTNGMSLGEEKERKTNLTRGSHTEGDLGGAEYRDLDKEPEKVRFQTKDPGREDGEWGNVLGKRAQKGRLGLAV